MARPIVNAVQLLGYLSTITAMSVLAGVGIYWMKSEFICDVDGAKSWLARLLRGEPDKVSTFVFRALPFVVAYNVLLSLCVFMFCVWGFRAPGSSSSSTSTSMAHRLRKESRSSGRHRRLDGEREPLTDSSSSKASWTTARSSVTLMAPVDERGGERPERQERRLRVRLPMDVSYYDNCHQAVSEAEFRQQLADETHLRRPSDIRGF